MTEVNKIDLTFYIDYVHIDKHERTLFHTNEIEYLYDYFEPPIQKLMINDVETVELHYTKPVKELIMVFSNHSETSDIYDFKKIDNLEIKLNNIKLETTNDETYFRLIQPFYHNRKASPDTFIYTYSFALDPDNTQPTGNFDFGKLKSKTLTIKGDLKDKNYIVNIYANVNNILNVDKGLCSVQYL